ncbi:uncharacterized protein LOC113391212 [Ctenocephalides felis]|uniref:uncharacterized protein LOC113391212 n=1 Tax=Ctenocephalides felis TaxID=7515 RepID=UPI000E6E19FA|nr:uncharacterized protein LOC113391212 [Ctenocephalides felis]
MPFLENAFATDATIKLYDEMAFEEEEFDSIDELILKAFTKQKFDDLLKYTIYVERQINETDARKDMELKDLPQYFFCVITKLVLQSKPKNQGNDVAPISEDLKKQIDEQTNDRDIKMTIQFSEIISKALPIIEKMLFSKAAHDSNEAITFFASSIDLGISSAYDSLLQVLYLLVTQEGE